MDEEFHSELSRMAGNNYLDFMLGKVGDIIRICRHYVIGSIPKANSSREHIAIINAILDGDAKSALSHMRLHIENTRDGLIEYISRHPEATGPAVGPLSRRSWKVRDPSRRLSRRRKRSTSGKNRRWRRNSSRLRRRSPA